MCTLIDKAVYGRLLMQSLTLKHLSSVILRLFEEFERYVFFRPFPRANLRGCKSRTTAETKMELFGQVTLCLRIFERKIIVLVPETRVLYGV